MISEASIQNWIFSYSVYINWKSFERPTIHLNPSQVSVKPGGREGGGGGGALMECKWGSNRIFIASLLCVHRIFLASHGTATPVVLFAFIFIIIILYNFL